MPCSLPRSHQGHITETHGGIPLQSHPARPLTLMSPHWAGAKRETPKCGLLKCREEPPKLLGNKFQERYFVLQDRRLLLLKEKRVRGMLWHGLQPRGWEEEPGDSSGTLVAVLLAGRLAPSRAGTHWMSFPRVPSQSVSGPWTQPRFTWALGRS